MKKLVLNKFILAILITTLGIGCGVGIYFNWQITIAILVVALAVVLTSIDIYYGVILAFISLAIGQLVRVPIASWGGSILPSDIMMVILLVVFIFKKIRSGINFSPSKLNFWILIFIIWVLIGLVFSLNLVLTSEMFKASLYLVRWIISTGIFFIILESDKEKLSRYLYTLIGFGLFVAVAGFVQLFYVPDFAFMKSAGWDPHSGRLLSTFFDPNFTGGFLSLILLIDLGWLFWSKYKKEQLFLGITGIILFIALILTYSRSAYLGFIVGFVILALFKSWKVAVIGIAIIGILIFSVPKSFQRIQSTWQGDESSNARIVSWQEGAKIISDHPIIGVGYNNLPNIKFTYGFDEEGKVAHSSSGIDSSLLTLWATTGIFGLLVYLVIYFKPIINMLKLYFQRKLNKSYQGVVLGVVAGILGLFFESQFVNSWFFAPIMFCLFFLWGLLANPNLIKKVT